METLVVNNVNVLKLDLSSVLSELILSLCCAAGKVELSDCVGYNHASY